MPAASHAHTSPVPQPRKILVRGVNWLGDAVMTTPALQRLREALPETQITLLTPEKLAGLWDHHPSVNEVMTFRREETALQIGRRLRAGNFDAALVLPNSPRSAVEVFLAAIPRRIGYARPWRNLFLTQRVPPRPEAVSMRRRPVAEIKRILTLTTPPRAEVIPAGAHQSGEYLHLAATLGARREPLPPQLVVTQAEVQALKRRFNILPEAGEARAWLGLSPGAEYGPAKRWPPARYVAAAMELGQRARCRWLLVGGPAEVDLATRMAAEIRGEVMNLAGQTTLRELCAALKMCAVVLTNDSGPMHVAAAVGTPVVALFGSTSPELTGPGLPGDARHRLLKGNAACAPCFRRECPIDFRCMQGISVEGVVEAVLRTLQQQGRREA